jgi:hypothetical protein
MMRISAATLNPQLTRPCTDVAFLRTNHPAIAVAFDRGGLNAVLAVAISEQ